MAWRVRSRQLTCVPVDPLRSVVVPIQHGRPVEGVVGVVVDGVVGVVVEGVVGVVAVVW